MVCLLNMVQWKAVNKVNGHRVNRGDVCVVNLLLRCLEGDAIDYTHQIQFYWS